MKYDIIGNREKAVAIVEIEGENEKEVAGRIMKANKNVKSVLKKASERKGEHRLRELELVAGDENTEVVHREYGYLIKVDPVRAYFSPREATERVRVASLVKPNEVVMLFFAGVGAFGLAIAKKQPKVEKVIAIEMNRDAVNYMIDNVRINKVAHQIVPINGEVDEKASKWFNSCDRVIMPLPKGAEEYLETAVKCLKKEGIVHLYAIADEMEFDDVKKRIMKKLKNSKIIHLGKVSQYSPGKWKIVIDIEVRKD